MPNMEQKIVAEQESLIGHLERYLGEIECGWTRSPDGEKMPFQVARCRGGILEGTAAYCTIGLSKFSLCSVKSSRNIKQELLIFVREPCDAPNVPAVLQQLAAASLHHESPYLRGEIIERSNPMFRGKNFVAFYAAAPFLLPDEFGVVTGKTEDDVVLVWMIPITADEAAFVREFGWREFENLIQARQVDLSSLNRESILRAP
jgi:suppressor of fused protein SUFU